MNGLDADALDEAFLNTLNSLISARGIAMPDEAFMDAMCEAIDTTWYRAVISAGTAQESDSEPRYQAGVTEGPESNSEGSPAVSAPREPVSSGTALGTDIAPMAPVPVSGGTAGITAGTAGISVPVSVGTTLAPVPVSSDTSGSADLFERGTKRYQESVSAGKPMSDRELARFLGQSGTRLARKIKAHVQTETEKPTNVIAIKRVTA